MDVVVKGWHERSAVALVDGVRVRVDRNQTRTRWRCDEHGPTINAPGCEHTQALFDTPIPTKGTP